jgi:hypothetical protein
LTRTEGSDFEAFSQGRYPQHQRRLVASRRSRRFAVLKAVVGINAFFGVPLCAVVWGGRIFLERHAASFQDGPNPLGVLVQLDPVAQILMVGILVICTIVAIPVGLARTSRLTLAIEEDEMRLRTAFLLEEWADGRVAASPTLSRGASSLDPGGGAPERHADDDLLVRRPGLSAKRPSSPAPIPPLTDGETTDRDGPSVAPGDFFRRDSIPLGAHARGDGMGDNWGSDPSKTYS